MGAVLIESSPNLSIYYAGDFKPPSENAVVILNHISYVDWAWMYGFCKRNNRLGQMKFMLKEPIKYIPGFGWGMYLLEWLFLKRDWEKDKENVYASLNRYSRDYVKNREPLWLFVFPEGTRFTLKKLKESHEFAKKKDLPILESCLLPRVKGFVTVVQGLRKNCIHAIYDITLAYSGFPATSNGVTTTGIPSLKQLLLSTKKGRKVILHVKRYALSELPETDEGLTEWLMERWVEKDKKVTEYHDKGNSDFW
eukprot:CAMPEP_0184664960 /NCGR_PEP_ID=MMETSP0308-20130426/54991_1 /TAXON_ID=38269 /ORGANISM="Gloeochaete witrockiana, Strain SAG 46.84" /LENGTH=251 /DNA_ID=CAMNT_0027108663 /DNA_START=183 /DNA_END=935 /DNA_ORIENTATION=-